MTVSMPLEDRDTFLRDCEQEVKRWSHYIDTLLAAYRSNEHAPVALHSQLEDVRHKRDTFATKLVAMTHHRDSGWFEARRELESARRELRDSWRTVIGVLGRESLFV